MKIYYSESGCLDYLYWQNNDREILQLIVEMVWDIQRQGRKSYDKSLSLSGELSGWWSIRIDSGNYLVYRIIDDIAIEVLSCKGLPGGKNNYS